MSEPRKYSQILSLGEDIARSAALVCSHCASGAEPIRVARRDDPVHDVDTGWQFHCDAHDHTEDTPQVWAVADVVELDAGVRAILDNPPHSSFRREGADVPWVAEAYDEAP